MGGQQPSCVKSSGEIRKKIDKNSNGTTREEREREIENEQAEKGNEWVEWGSTNWTIINEVYSAAQLPNCVLASQ